MLRSMALSISRVQPVRKTPARPNCRTLKSQSENESFFKRASSPTEWRKKQLDDLERKWDAKPLDIASDEDLQPMWKNMESRVKSRRPRTLEETGGKTGRRNIKRTDEEMWLQEGLYDQYHEDERKKK
jgi:hypothetical protein